MKLTPNPICAPGGTVMLPPDPATTTSDWK
jgi:hypothetical protein